MEVPCAPFQVPNMDGFTVISVSPNSTKRLPNVTDTWNRENTRLLIKLYRANHQRIGLSPAMKTKRSMWRLIRDELENLGHHFTSVQVENRWKTLLRGHKKTLANINTNRSRHSNEFQKELSELDTESNFLVPEITLSSFGTFRKLKGFASSTPEPEHLKTESVETEIPLETDVEDELLYSTLHVDPPLIPSNDYSPGQLSPISCCSQPRSKQSLQQEYVKLKMNCLKENLELRKEKLVEYAKRTSAIERRNELIEQLVLSKFNQLGRSFNPNAPEC